MEEAVDLGGVFREWIQKIVSEILSPDQRLFSASDASAAENYIFCEMASGEDKDVLKKGELAGRIFGKAVLEGVPVGIRFAPIIYRLMLHKGSLELFDYMKALQELDPQVYENLAYLMKNPAENFELYFEANDGGKSRALVDDGENIAVTDDNKDEYVRLMAKTRLVGNVSASVVEAFIKGFQYIATPSTLNACGLNADGIEGALYGREIDVDEWQTAALYGEGQHRPSAELIGWFWGIMGEFTQERRRQMLHFTTSLNRVPIKGFEGIPGGKFKIEMSYKPDPEGLPESQTCFSTLKLHPYESKGKMKEKLEKALDMASKGFGMG